MCKHVCTHAIAFLLLSPVSSKFHLVVVSLESVVVGQEAATTNNNRSCVSSLFNPYTSLMRFHFNVTQVCVGHCLLCLVCYFRIFRVSVLCLVCVCIVCQWPCFLGPKLSALTVFVLVTYRLLNVFSSEIMVRDIFLVLNLHSSISFLITALMVWVCTFLPLVTEISCHVRLQYTS